MDKELTRLLQQCNEAVTRTSEACANAKKSITELELYVEKLQQDGCIGPTTLEFMQSLTEGINPPSGHNVVDIGKEREARAPKLPPAPCEGK